MTTNKGDLIRLCWDGHCTQTTKLGRQSHRVIDMQDGKAVIEGQLGPFAVRSWVKVADRPHEPRLPMPSIKYG